MINCIFMNDLQTNDVISRINPLKQSESLSYHFSDQLSHKVRVRIPQNLSMKLILNYENTDFKTQRSLLSNLLKIEQITAVLHGAELRWPAQCMLGNPCEPEAQATQHSVSDTFSPLGCG